MDAEGLLDLDWHPGVDNATARTTIAVLLTIQGRHLPHRRLLSICVICGSPICVIGGLAERPPRHGAHHHRGAPHDPTLAIVRHLRLYPSAPSAAHLSASSAAWPSVHHAKARTTTAVLLTIHRRHLRLYPSAPSAAHLSASSAPGRASTTPRRAPRPRCSSRSNVAIVPSAALSIGAIGGSPICVIGGLAERPPRHGAHHDRGAPHDPTSPTCAICGSIHRRHRRLTYLRHRRPGRASTTPRRAPRPRCSSRSNVANVAICGSIHRRHRRLTYPRHRRPGRASTTPRRAPPPRCSSRSKVAICAICGSIHRRHRRLTYLRHQRLGRASTTPRRTPPPRCSSRSNVAIGVICGSPICVISGLAERPPRHGAHRHHGAPHDPTSPSASSAALSIGVICGSPIRVIGGLPHGDRAGATTVLLTIEPRHRRHLRLSPSASSAAHLSA